jgi:hypothetical protein
MRSLPSVALVTDGSEGRSAPERMIRIPKRTHAEQETIIRWDEEALALDVYTASPLVARRLIGLGYALKAVPGGWRGTAPLDSLQFRPLVHGAPKKCRYCSDISSVARTARSNGAEPPLAPSPTGVAPQEPMSERGRSWRKRA